ncbi:1,5-anhydro-D-fructose reductase-like [Bombyx mandarina]|uniref:1,5-anhydro-D-fructose reductase-like n=1 Tax=Bombyx mandarina TaxID=7092 RepID=A0A6J2JUQ3_BOMMA|nr:1,5-anhydro-D-fructose reductase-like [Bombyx mandarina]XP_028032623.1 1,5-anhydro-D-fructose reductase-like [Bombyx mandarina]
MDCGLKLFRVLKISFRTRFCFYYCYNKIMKHVELSYTKDLMPTLGLGTWQAPSDVIESTVYKALDLGYRHIDTAFNYNNEESIGRALKKWIDDGKGTRTDLFVTTKLPHVGNRASDVKKFLELQLSRLQLDYVDLYLIHVPFGFHCDPETLTPRVKSDGEYDVDMDTNHLTIWKEMELCQREGLIRNLGLSNFNEEQIRKISKSSTIKPQVLQVELHAYFQQQGLRKFCTDNDIVVTAYAPLGSPGAKDHFVTKYNYSPDTFPDLLNLPQVKEIADKHGRTPAQILLNFLVQQKVVVIPKSTSEHRLRENMNIYDFELSAPEMDLLKKLDKGESGRIFNFLFWKGVEKHPEYPFHIEKNYSSKDKQ